MELKKISLSKIRPYEKNARKNDEAVEYVIKSIQQCEYIAPIILDENNVILAGHTRYKALKKLGYKEAECVIKEGLTEEQKKKYRLLDNKTAEYAEWDFDLLENELADLDFGDLDIDWGIDEIFEGDSKDTKNQGKGSLCDKFIIPPFSILDARQGYWINRKKLWREKTGDLSESRDGEFGKIGGGSKLMEEINGGTSNFDPVLAEIMFKWFCPPNGHILDPFGGEQTKGVVAGECGFKYSAVEFRQEQVDVNNKATINYSDVKYICGDSNNISKLIKKRGFDMCFTSPPYYDLEVYSKEDMSALGTYEEFMSQYYNIFKQCYEMLDNDTFLVIKVGEIRDKKTGVYRNFVGDTIDIMIKCGFKYYNELILATSISTMPVRAGRSMRSRKICKGHQNVLVFYKGNTKNISTKFPVLDFSEMDENVWTSTDSEEE